MSYDDPTAGQVDSAVISADIDKEDSETPELQQAPRREGLELAAHLVDTAVRNKPIDDAQALAAANALALIAVAQAAQQAAAAVAALNEHLKDEEA